ncbi:MAG: HDOD domain-containing protein [Deltaproteobacteria bacterium]|jgi:putative nucleotidyltransferase with HDIG domain|nr:HDOD domain-containing protein [Deltaproteobacteria bacterium]
MAKPDIPKSEAEFKEIVFAVAKTLLTLIEEKDPYLRKHSERVASNSANFCEQYEIVATEDVETVYLAGLLHDIGIVAIPIDLLHRAEPLTEEEMVRIRKHPVSGEKVLSSLFFLEDVLPLVRHHHEAFDGSGYPDRLKGDDIPVGARVLGMFNSLDTLMFPRHAAKALSVEDALVEINAKAGKQFDQGLIQNFMAFVKSNAGKSEDYLQKKQANTMRSIFTEILSQFKSGKINPPVMPQVVREMQTVIKQPKSTPEQLAEVIEKDPTISLRLISVANSPVYRGITEIRNVKSAIPRLGLKETLNIVLAIANKNLYESKNVKFKILMDKLWVHALACAYGSKLIAQSLKLEDQEKYFLMGLIHDIGKILLLKAFSEVKRGGTLKMDAIEANVQEAHIGLGSMLLKRWGFDAEFINVINHHEDKEFSPDTVKEILVVHLANILTRQIGLSLFEVDVDFAEVESAKILKLEPDQIETFGEEVKSIIADVAHLF